MGKGILNKKETRSSADDERVLLYHQLFCIWSGDERSGSGIDDFAVLYRQLTIEYNVVDPGGLDEDVFKGGAIFDSFGVENGEIGVTANFDAAFFVECQSFRGNDGHLL